jgi:Pyruvate/2-oxoacid:ferredoxin oxidoreductase delta subunit/5-hydroxyisourate hydrolase-like protein (transthyretin family)
MEQNDQIYIKLQKHLDNQAVGFPATKTGVEIRILKHIFTPKEAEIASLLSYRFEPLKIIYSRVEHLVESPEELEKILDSIQKKGGIEFKIKNDKKHYCNAPLVVGMYEYQLDRLTPDFIKDFNDYTSDKNFGIEFLSTELPQMRTIPIARSIHPEYNVSTFDEVTTLLQQAEEPFVIIECICRKKKSIEGEFCKVTDRKETCLAIGGMAQMTLANDVGRKITRDEAMSIIEQNQKEGLVLQPSNTKIAEFICSCCGCCCGMLGLHKTLPKPLNFWATNFHAVVDKNTCEGCGNCEESCQVGAVSVSEKELYAVVNLDRCLGCGVCVSNCPTESISLLKKPIEVIPPQTREELFDIIMDRKKGRFGKLMLTGKLFFDAVRTGQTHLLKS